MKGRNLENFVANREDMEMWLNSPAYRILRDTIGMLNESVRGRLRSSVRCPSPAVCELVAVFGRLRKILAECPRVDNGVCFANPGFRIWRKNVGENVAEILANVTDNADCYEYFLNSFGNASRLDFGTGHELHFLAFIACLLSLGHLKESDAICIVLDVFWEYWNFYIALQDQYRLEPAGSAGAWGIDDYVALPFVFGSSQLIGEIEISPESIINLDVAEKRFDDNCYSKWIKYLYTSKSGDFAEHSRGLYSLRTMRNFEDLNKGMLKVYEQDVLGRFFVVQQFGFGEILRVK
jgi:serine/threonine-protein phosphatase 2A activator